MKEEFMKNPTAATLGLHGPPAVATSKHNPIDS
jgi:hypothetical protein